MLGKLQPSSRFLPFFFCACIRLRALNTFACLFSWKYGSSHPEGTVDEVVPGDAEIETKNGNSVTRHGGEYIYASFFFPHHLI